MQKNSVLDSVSHSAASKDKKTKKEKRATKKQQKRVEKMEEKGKSIPVQFALPTMQARPMTNEQIRELRTPQIPLPTIPQVAQPFVNPFQAQPTQTLPTTKISTPFWVEIDGKKHPVYQTLPTMPLLQMPQMTQQLPGQMTIGDVLKALNQMDDDSDEDDDSENSHEFCACPMPPTVLPIPMPTQNSLVAAMSQTIPMPTQMPLSVEEMARRERDAKRRLAKSVNMALTNNSTIRAAIHGFDGSAVNEEFLGQPHVVNKMFEDQIRIFEYSKMQARLPNRTRVRTMILENLPMERTPNFTAIIMDMKNWAICNKIPKDCFVYEMSAVWELFTDHKFGTLYGLGYPFNDYPTRF